MNWPSPLTRWRSVSVVAGAAILLVMPVLVGTARAREGAGSAAKVAAEIRQFIRARAVPGLEAIELPQLDSFEVGGADAGPVEVNLSTRVRAPFSGRVPITVEMKRAGQLVKRAVVTARVRASRRVIVSTRALRRGSVLERADLALAERDTSTIRDGAGARVDDFIGLRLARSLAAGGILLQGWVEPVPIIGRGEPVRVRYDDGGLHIDGTGIAREEGGAGQTIAVEVRESRRQLSGRVDRNGVVHVGF